jgi:hypothetical protein
LLSHISVDLLFGDGLSMFHQSAPIVELHS